MLSDAADLEDGFPRELNARLRGVLGANAIE